MFPSSATSHAVKTVRVRQNNRSWLWVSVAVLTLVASALAMINIRLGPGVVHAAPGFPAKNQFITLSTSGTYLVNSYTNQPVFLVGDSGWSMITQLDNSDLDLYLKDRASRGFNYIWAAAADNYYQSNAPQDFYGNVPFDGADFTNFDATYWAHVDYVVKRAAHYGITVALNPGFVGLSTPGGYLQSYLNSSDAVVTAYGAFLGARYKNYPNVIWALGGDVDPSTGVVPKITDLANGILSSDTNHLIVAEGHPQLAALDTFAGTTWMNLNWLYFHTTNIPPGANFNYSRSPWLPPFEGEAWYENENSITEFQLRQQGYWAVLCGAYLGNAGFGNNPIWYFNGGPDEQPGTPPWQSELGYPGSVAQSLMGRLFRTREHWLMVPDVNNTVLTGGYGSGATLSVAGRTSDGQTIIAYFSDGNTTVKTINMSMITSASAKAKAWWFNPQTGSAFFIGMYPTTGSQNFTAPDANDWVLVIDDAGANLSPPGPSDVP
jgi:hypothetical protein